MKEKNFLVLGSGGREHALALKISQSKHCGKLFIVPGNPGTAFCGTNVPIKETDFESLAKFCEEKHIDIIVVGPETPLVAGIKDFFVGKPVAVVGPSKDAAQLEGSKAVAKYFMEKYEIPTAQYHVFDSTEREDAVEYINCGQIPPVVKASGLAAGKGVLVPKTHQEAIDELDALFSGKFGEAGQEVVLEEFLFGIEFSVFVLTDGTDYQILPIAKDYKRLGDGDIGPNTGGMGAISPVPFVDDELLQKVKTLIIEPTLEGMREEGTPYTGFLYFGLMNVSGHPYVIEYNCRLGDPETQAVLPRINSDFGELLIASLDGTLADHSLVVNEEYSVVTVLAANGYPDSQKIQNGFPIAINFSDSYNGTVFFAGAKDDSGKGIVTSGGRVMAVQSFGVSAKKAMKRNHAMVEEINFEGKTHRTDIGADVLPQQV